VGSKLYKNGTCPWPSFPLVKAFSQTLKGVLALVATLAALSGIARPPLTRRRHGYAHIVAILVAIIVILVILLIITL